MGLLLGALSGAAKAVERTTEYALRSMMDEEKSKRIAEYTSRLKSDEDLTTRARNKGDAADERARVAEFTKPATSQPNGLLSAGAGLDDPAAAGADENVGRDVQKRERAPTIPEASAAALKAGDIKSAAEIGKLDDKDAANAIKLQIAQGRFENAIQIAQMKGDFGLMIGELKAAAANGSGKATELMRNIAALKGMGKSDKEAIDLLLGGKVGEYTTIQTESHDEKTGAKTVTTKKVKPQSESVAPQRSLMDLFPPKQNQQAPALAAPATSAPRMTTEDAQPQPLVVKLEPAGKTLLGGKQFIATYQDGTRKVISGDDAERQAILMGK